MPQGKMPVLKRIIYCAFYDELKRCLTESLLLINYVILNILTFKEIAFIFINCQKNISSIKPNPMHHEIDCTFI